MEDYKECVVIGKGSYGTVMKCRSEATGQYVAVKMMDGQNELARKTAVREAKILKQLQHPNVVRLLHLFRTSARLCMVFEHMDCSIMQMLAAHPRGLPAHEVKRILWQIVLALNFLHGQHIIHRDIKPENLLMDEKGTVKLCDFGFARPAASGSANLSPYVATRWYRAPEQLVGDKYGPAVDVWALGCLLVELSTGRPLFPGKTNVDQLRLIMGSVGCSQRQLAVMKTHPMLSALSLPDTDECEAMSLENRFNQLEGPAQALLRACLAPDPSSRPTAADLMQHDYFISSQALLAPYTEAHAAALQAMQAALEASLSDHPTQAPTAVDTSSLQPGGAPGGLIPVPPARPRTAHHSGTQPGVSDPGHHHAPLGIYAPLSRHASHRRSEGYMASRASMDGADVHHHPRTKHNPWVAPMHCNGQTNTAAPCEEARTQARELPQRAASGNGASGGSGRLQGSRPLIDIPDHAGHDSHSSPLHSPLVSNPSAKNVLLSVTGPLTASPPCDPLARKDSFRGLSRTTSIGGSEPHAPTHPPSPTPAPAPVPPSRGADPTVLALNALHAQLLADARPERTASFMEQQLRVSSQPGTPSLAMGSSSGMGSSLREGSMGSSLLQDYGAKMLPLSAGSVVASQRTPSITNSSTHAVKGSQYPARHSMCGDGESIEERYAALKAALGDRQPGGGGVSQGQGHTPSSPSSIGGAGRGAAATPFTGVPALESPLSTMQLSSKSYTGVLGALPWAASAPHSAANATGPTRPAPLNAPAANSTGSFMLPSPPKGVPFLPARRGSSVTLLRPATNDPLGVLLQQDAQRKQHLTVEASARPFTSAHAGMQAAAAAAAAAVRGSFATTSSNAHVGSVSSPCATSAAGLVATSPGQPVSRASLTRVSMTHVPLGLTPLPRHPSVTVARRTASISYVPKDYNELKAAQAAQVNGSVGAVSQPAASAAAADRRLQGFVRGAWDT